MNLDLLKNIKVGQCGQVTIPNELRDGFGIGPGTDVEFSIVEWSIDLAKWKGRCALSFRNLSYSSMDKFIEDPRPMTTAIDTNILLDLLIPNQHLSKPLKCARK